MKCIVYFFLRILVIWCFIWCLFLPSDIFGISFFGVFVFDVSLFLKCSIWWFIWCILLSSHNSMVLRCFVPTFSTLAPALSNSWIDSQSFCQAANASEVLPSLSRDSVFAPLPTKIEIHWLCPWRATIWRAVRFVLGHTDLTLGKHLSTMHRQSAKTINKNKCYVYTYNFNFYNKSP